MTNVILREYEKCKYFSGGQYLSNLESIFLKLELHQAKYLYNLLEQFYIDNLEFNIFN